MTWFGEYGGQFVPETLIPALEELDTAWSAARKAALRLATAWWEVAEARARLAEVA